MEPCIDKIVRMVQNVTAWYFPVPRFLESPKVQEDDNGFEVEALHPVLLVPCLGGLRRRRHRGDRKLALPGAIQLSGKVHLPRP